MFLYCAKQSYNFLLYNYNTVIHQFYAVYRHVDNNIMAKNKTMNIQIWNSSCKFVFKENKQKSNIIKSVKKIVTDKKLVSSYIKGEISIQTLTKKGIKFAKPL